MDGNSGVDFEVEYKRALDKIVKLEENIMFLQHQQQPHQVSNERKSTSTNSERDSNTDAAPFRNTQDQTNRYYHILWNPESVTNDSTGSGSNSCMMTKVDARLQNFVSCSGLNGHMSSFYSHSATDDIGSVMEVLSSFLSETEKLAAQFIAEGGRKGNSLTYYSKNGNNDVNNDNGMKESTQPARPALNNKIPIPTACIHKFAQHLVCLPQLTQAPSLSTSSNNSQTDLNTTNQNVSKFCPGKEGKVPATAIPVGLYLESAHLASWFRKIDSQKQNTHSNSNNDKDKFLHKPLRIAYLILVSARFRLEELLNLVRTIGEPHHFICIVCIHQVEPLSTPLSSNFEELMSELADYPNVITISLPSSSVTPASSPHVDSSESYYHTDIPPLSLLEGSLAGIMALLLPPHSVQSTTAKRGSSTAEGEGTVPEWHYLVTLCEEDFPIKSSQEIESTLLVESRNRTSNFVGQHQLTLPSSPSWHHLNHTFITCQQNTWYTTELPFSHERILHDVTAFVLSSVNNNSSENYNGSGSQYRKSSSTTATTDATDFVDAFSFWEGSPWVVLSREFCEFVVSSLEVRNRWLPFFATTYAPHRFFWPSILLNSKKFSHTVDGFTPTTTVSTNNVAGLPSTDTNKSNAPSLISSPPSSSSRDWHYIAWGRPQEKLWDKDIASLKKMKNHFWARSVKDKNLQHLIITEMQHQQRLEEQP